MFLAEAILLYVKYILHALEENAFLSHSNSRMGPSTESNPHRFELRIGNPYRHRRKGEEAHLHTGRIQSKT
jgi:hypothetical protein